MNSLTNLNFIERNVGSKIKSTKKQYIWEFTLDNKNHKIEYFDSLLSSKRKVLIDGKVLFTTEDGYKDSFILNFQFDGHNYTINRTYDRVDLRIDSESFEHVYYIEKNKLYYNNNPEPTVYTTVGKSFEKNNNFSLKDNFYSHQINQPQNVNKNILFNFKIKNEEKKQGNFSKFKFGGDDNSFQQVNNSYQNNNKNINKLNQSTQQSHNLLDLDISNDDDIKNNNLSFQHSNNELLNDIFREKNNNNNFNYNNQGQNYVNMQNQFNNTNYINSNNNINNNYIQSTNQMNNFNMILQNQQMINQNNTYQNNMNINYQTQPLSQNNFNMNNQYNLNNNNTQFQNNNLSNNNNNFQNINNQYNHFQFQNNNQINNNINNQYNNMNNNQFSNNSLNNNNFNMINNNLNNFY